MSNEPDVSRYSPLWTERFRDLNAVTHQVESMDDEGNTLDGVVQGTLTMAIVEMATTNEEAALVLKFVPQGELDPHASIAMHLNMVHPDDATTLWRSITNIMVCDQLRDEIYAIIDAHQCEEGDNTL